MIADNDEVIDPKSISLDEIIRSYYSDTFSGVHPAADIFDMLPDDELDALTKSIAERGLETTIYKTDDNLLLDGRNRLVACFRAGVEIRTMRCSGDPYGTVFAMNIARRHLNAGQRAMYANRLRDMYDKAAKERKAENGGDKKSEEAKKSDMVILPYPISEPDYANTAREMAGKAANVSGKYMDMARDVSTHGTPDLIKDVASGRVSLPSAHKQIIPIKAEAATKAKEPLFGTAVNLNGEHRPVRMAEKQGFNKTNDSVSWASWTWNPVTGCNHGCNFCYARAIVNNPQMSANYPHGFDPALYEFRLEAPKNMVVKPSENPADGRVFVGSMADLFGKWVPDEWITKVFNACMENTDWEYLFLTKWPKRYALLADLPKAWFGASIIKQADVARVERDMQSFQTKGIKWVSLEPMLEPIIFNDLSWCDLMVIGSQTGTSQPDGWVPPFAAKFEWVASVVAQCREAGVPVYLKPNLLTDPGMDMPMEMPRIR